MSYKLEISKLENDIRCLLNRESAENESDTPDWVLASYLRRCLDTFNACVNMRERYYGRELRQKSTRIVDIEDCTILGYNWTELKRVVDFAKMHGYPNHKE